MIGRSSSVQVTLLASRRCQPCSSAYGCRAGAHWAACESPSSAMDTGDAGSPHSQVGCSVATQVTKHPLVNTFGTSAFASLSDGVRFDGTSTMPTDEAT